MHFLLHFESGQLLFLCLIFALVRTNLSFWGSQEFLQGKGSKQGLSLQSNCDFFSPGHREDGAGGKHMAFLLLFVNLDCEFLVIKLFIYFS